MYTVPIHDSPEFNICRDKPTRALLSRASSFVINQDYRSEILNFNPRRPEQDVCQVLFRRENFKSIRRTRFCLNLYFIRRCYRARRISQEFAFEVKRKWVNFQANSIAMKACGSFDGREDCTRANIWNDKISRSVIASDQIFSKKRDDLR